MAATMMATPRSVTIVAAPIVSFLVGEVGGSLLGLFLLGQEPGQGQAVAGHVQAGRAGELAAPDERGYAVKGAGQLDAVVEDVVDVVADLEDGPQHPVQEEEAHGRHHGDENKVP